MGISMPCFRLSSQADRAAYQPPPAPPTVTALVAPNFKRMIDHKSLPTRILQTEREDIGIAEFIIESLDNSVTIPAI